MATGINTTAVPCPPMETYGIYRIPMLIDGTTQWTLEQYKAKIDECVTNKTGKNAGKHSIWFNGNRKDSNGVKKEYCKKQFEKYVCKDFSRFY